MTSTLQSATLQAAALAGHLAGIACHALLEFVAPLDKPAAVPNDVMTNGCGGKSPRTLSEPPFTEDERVGLRQLLDERFPLPDLAAPVEPLPSWVHQSSDPDGARNNIRGAAAAESPAPASNRMTAGCHSTGAGRTAGIEIAPAATLMTKSLAIAAAIGLREFADSDACETPGYWRSIADQLDPPK